MMEDRENGMFLRFVPYAFCTMSVSMLQRDKDKYNQHK